MRYVPLCPIGKSLRVKPGSSKHLLSLFDFRSYIHCPYATYALAF
ncbi:MAG: hypothetical protein ACOX80_04785 [Methanomassiliicoccaceae archaeon]|nr:hypothetical protein [Methanomassiliicoccaceae archaeon]